MSIEPLPSCDLDLFGPETLANPYPLYHRLRARAPVYWAERLKGWLVTGYDAVNILARSPKVSIQGKSDLTGQRIKDFRTQMLLLRLSQNLIGNGTLALLRHPDQYRKLCDNPALVPNAVEEMMRYDCSVQISVRKAVADLAVGGATIRSGQLLFLIWGAANRDPAQFPDPDWLDVTRPDIKHVALGAGIHYCLGAVLARLEAQIAFTAMVRRFPHMRLATEQLKYRDNHNLRELETLPVVVA